MKALRFEIAEIFELLDNIPDKAKRQITLPKTDIQVRVSHRHSMTFNVLYQRSKCQELSCSQCGVKPSYITYHQSQGLRLMIGKKNFLNLDHIIPFSKGGSSANANLEIMCHRCNGRKSDKLDETLIKGIDLDMVFHTLQCKFVSNREELNNLKSRFINIFQKTKIPFEIFKQKVWLHVTEIIGNVDLNFIRFIPLGEC